MTHIIAFDGGGTKTHMGIFNDVGELLYEIIGPGSNHQGKNGDAYIGVIQTLYEDGLKALSLKPSDIDLVFLGLSGADIESDFVKLYGALRPIFAPVKIKIANDAWIMMRSGLSTPFGAVAISGTGTNAAARNKEGKEAILRSLGYVLGTYGGGLDIAREGLHYAFRADELTYQDTRLKQDIMRLLNAPNMDAVVAMFYPKQTIDKQTFGAITGVVFDAAKQNDDVAIEILKKVGRTIAQQTLGVMKQVDITHLEVPVVIGGRVFYDETTPLMQAFKQTLQHDAPQAYVVRPKYKPYVGAYLSALDELGISQSKLIEKNLSESGCDL